MAGGVNNAADIEAANAAIQAAQTAGVKVHTYFGTPAYKSGAEEVSAEYARVAQETGGAAFTSNDSISGFAGVLEKVICGSRPPEPEPTVPPPAPEPTGPSIIDIRYVNTCVTLQSTEWSNVLTGLAGYNIVYQMQNSAAAQEWIFIKPDAPTHNGTVSFGETLAIQHKASGLYLSCVTSGHDAEVKLVPSLGAHEQWTLVKVGDEGVNGSCDPGEPGRLSEYCLG